MKQYLLALLCANLVGASWATGDEAPGSDTPAAQAPTSARLSMGRGEVDPAWPVIRFLVRRGWASVRHAQPKLKQAVAA